MPLSIPASQDMAVLSVHSIEFDVAEMCGPAMGCWLGYYLHDNELIATKHHFDAVFADIDVLYLTGKDSRWTYVMTMIAVVSPRDKPIRNDSNFQIEVDEYWSQLLGEPFLKVSQRGSHPLDTTDNLESNLEPTVGTDYIKP